MAAPTITIRRATPTDLPTILTLLDRYNTEWDIWQRDPPSTILDYLNHPTLGFFLAELDAAPDQPPANAPAGCVLLRPLPTIPEAAEFKRLYVLPEARGHRLADALMQAAEDHARAAHLTWLYLDSKPEFTTAIALYRRRNYLDTPRFNDNPQATLFLRKRL